MSRESSRPATRAMSSGSPARRTVKPFHHYDESPSNGRSTYVVTPVSVEFFGTRDQEVVTMSVRQPYAERNFDGYGAPPINWDRARQVLDGAITPVVRTQAVRNARARRALPGGTR